MTQQTTRNELLIEALAIAVLAALAAGTGVLWQGDGPQVTFETLRGEVVSLQGHGLYRHDTVSFAAQAIAQDWVTLFVGIPLLLIGAFLQKSGRLIGQLLVAGTFGYFAYTYVSYAFGDAYNELFLLYVALVTLSLFALTRSIMTIDVAALPERFLPGFPRRSIATFLFAVAAFLLFAWLGRIVPALFAGAPPFGLESYTTLPIQVLDLGVIVPLAMLAGTWLLRGTAWGYLLTAIVLLKGITMTTAVSAMAFNMVRLGIPISAVEATMFPALTLVGIAMAIIYLRHIKPA